MIHTEIHITVLNSHAELFKLTCKKFGIKYTEISFLSDKENHLMTSIRKKFDKLKEIYDYFLGNLKNILLVLSSTFAIKNGILSPILNLS